MPAVRRSETAPRRSSRSVEIQKKADQEAKRQQQQQVALDKKNKQKAAKAAAAAAKKEESSTPPPTTSSTKVKASKAKKGAKAESSNKKTASSATKKARDLKPKVDAAADKVKKTTKKAVKAGADKVEKTASEPAKKPKARAAPKARGTAAAAADNDKKASKPAAKKKATAAAEKKPAQDAKKDKKVGKGYKVGDVVADISLKDDEDKEVSLATLYNETGLVILSYPKANTPGCTTQACNYRDLASEIEQLGYKVVGLSKDKPKAQASWKAKHSFKYSLLSDPDGELLSKLGATDAKKRCHWVIEKGGKLVEAKLGVKPADDAKNALEFVKSLENKKD
ncbi:hypothetical protein JCM10212_005768 [Sporobolomyces blumeae]